MGRLIIAGGRILDPTSDVDEVGDVVVEDGRIVSRGGRADPGSDDVVFDADGCLVTPGLIDPHVHLREPGFEDAETIASGAAVAIDGGFTTVCCMPNTTPTLDTARMMEFVLRQSTAAKSCRVFPIGAVTVGRKGEQLAEMGLMHRAGAVGFSDDGDVVESPRLMRLAFAMIAPTGLALMQHCQEPSLTRGASMNAGPTATRLGLGGWPSLAEELIIERDIRLNQGIGCRYHVQHLSAGGSVEIVRRAQAAGEPVSAEASPHHLLLTDDACDGYNQMAKMNPPLRSANDLEAVREGVRDGTITVLATDHAPHTIERKTVPFDKAAFGIVGLETALALYHKALIASGLIDWPAMIRMMTRAPADLCGLGAGDMSLGRLTIGTSADITIIDPEMKWTIRADELTGKSRNTPFDGWDVQSRAIGAIVGGRVMLDRSGRLRSANHAKQRIG